MIWSLGVSSKIRRAAAFWHVVVAHQLRLSYFIGYQVCNLPQTTFTPNPIAKHFIPSLLCHTPRNLTWLSDQMQRKILVEKIHDTRSFQYINVNILSLRQLLLSRRSRQRERLHVTGVSICSSVCLSVCRQIANTRFSQKLSNLELWCLDDLQIVDMGFSKNPLLDP